jgi:transcriptional regulator with XRE-family HTH domain
MCAAPKRSLVTRFPEVLRELRQARGISQEELAERAGLHRTYISQIERGIKIPTLRSLEQIAVALNTSVSTIVKRMEERSIVGVVDRKGAT